MLKFLDIETVPQAEQKLILRMPEEIKNPVLPLDLQVMPPFEPKLNHLKDPATLPLPESITDKDPTKEVEKRRKALDAINKAVTARRAAEDKQRERHGQEWEERRDKALQAFSDRRIKWFEDAALFPELSHVRIITTTHNEIIHCDIDGGSLQKRERPEFLKAISAQFPLVKFTLYPDEETLVRQFWQDMQQIVQQAKVDDSSRVVGFAIKWFDLPYMYRRAMLLGHIPPAKVVTGKMGPYQWESPYVDLQEVWGAGRREDRPSLSYCLQSFDLEPKSGEGSAFYKYWQADPTRAVEYAITDIQRTFELGGRMGYKPTKEELI